MLLFVFVWLIRFASLFHGCLIVIVFVLTSAIDAGLIGGWAETSHRLVCAYTRMIPFMLTSPSLCLLNLCISMRPRLIGRQTGACDRVRRCRWRTKLVIFHPKTRVAQTPSVCTCQNEPPWPCPCHKNPAIDLGADVCVWFWGHIGITWTYKPYKRMQVWVYHSPQQAMDNQHAACGMLELSLQTDLLSSREDLWPTGMAKQAEPRMPEPNSDTRTR